MPLVSSFYPNPLSPVPESQGAVVEIQLYEMGHTFKNTCFCWKFNIRYSQWPDMSCSLTDMWKNSNKTLQNKQRQQTQTGAHLSVTAAFTSAQAMSSVV